LGHALQRFLAQASPHKVRQAFIQIGIRVSVYTATRQYEIQGHPRLTGPTENPAGNERRETPGSKQVKSFRDRQQTATPDDKTAAVVFIGCD